MFLEALLNEIKSFLYIISGRRPFSKGFTAYKEKTLKQILSDSSFNINNIKPGYGFRLDERIVEYPWLLSRLPVERGRLLDAGSVLNFDFILSHPSLTTKKIFVSTLAPEKNCFWQRQISYLYEDLRETCYRDNYFDWIVSLSTLEHIGMDNTIFYTNHHSQKENRVNDYLITVQELHRILKPGGTLYLSFPFGRYKNHGWLQVFDTLMIEAILNTFSPSSFSENHFIYQAEGWTISSREISKNAIYFDWHHRQNYDTNFVVAAQAVVCLEMVK
jgi:SAM-dependent methyltransferase